jgi:hypothetical protein
MDKDQKDLVQHIFAIATMMLEDAHKLSVRGQSPRLAPRVRLKALRRLREICQNVIKVVDAAEVIAQRCASSK